jgi:hypothetical protein
MKRIMIGTTLITATLLLTGTPAFAAGSPQRPDGLVQTDLSSANGGDNGWGNCGHNSSGGASRGGLPGNGGYKPGDSCLTPAYQSTTAPSSPSTDSALTISAT